MFSNLFRTCLVGTPAQVSEDVIQFNTILFGVCEDRRVMGTSDNGINGKIDFLIVVPIEHA